MNIDSSYSLILERLESTFIKKFRKVNEVFNDVFYGKNKVYFEVGDSMGYVSDIKNNDVRTEGMSNAVAVVRNP